MIPNLKPNGLSPEIGNSPETGLLAAWLAGFGVALAVVLACRNTTSPKHHKLDADAIFIDSTNHALLRGLVRIMKVTKQSHVLQSVTYDNSI